MEAILALMMLAGIVFVPLALLFGPQRATAIFAAALKRFLALAFSALNMILERIRLGGFRLPSLGLPGFAPRVPVLCPEDPPPPAERLQDFFDYRGTATVREIPGLLGPDGVGLGRFLHPRGQVGPPVRLPVALLQRNCAVFGPPGSGKTEGIVIPWILELLGQKCSVVTVDVKGDLHDRLAGPAGQGGARVWYWNSADPARSQSWNFLDELQDHRDVEAAAVSILGRKNPHDSQPFFYERDYRWLRALLQVVKAAYGPGAKPRTLYGIVQSQGTLRDLFRNFPKAMPLAQEVGDLLQFSVQEHSRAVSGLANALHLFNSPEVVRVSERSDLSLSGLAGQPTLLVIGASLAQARAGEVLSSLALNQLFAVLYRRFAAGAPASAPVYFLIDEAARLRDRIKYEEVLSVARSAKVGICLSAQDVSQFGEEREAAAVLTNCLTFIALRGSSPETAKYLAGRLGQRFEQVSSVSTQRRPFDPFPQQSKSVQTVAVPVLGEREMMHPPVGRFPAVVQVSPVSPKPFLVELVRP